MSGNELYRAAMTLVLIDGKGSLNSQEIVPEPKWSR